MAVETAKRLWKARPSSVTRAIGAAVIVGCFAIVLFKYGVVLTVLFAVLIAAGTVTALRAPRSDRGP
jgi:hypothetical protein